MIKKVDLDLIGFRWEGFILSSELEDYSSNKAVALIWKLLLMSTLLATLGSSSSQDPTIQFYTLKFLPSVEHSRIVMWFCSSSSRDVLEEEKKKEK